MRRKAARKTLAQIKGCAYPLHATAAYQLHSAAQQPTHSCTTAPHNYTTARRSQAPTSSRERERRSIGRARVKISFAKFWPNFDRIGIRTKFQPDVRQMETAASGLKFLRKLRAAHTRRTQPPHINCAQPHNTRRIVAQPPHTTTQQRAARRRRAKRKFFRAGLPAAGDSPNIPPA